MPDKFSPPGLAVEIHGGKAALALLDQIYTKLREVEELQAKLNETPIELAVRPTDFGQGE